VESVGFRLRSLPPEAAIPGDFECSDRSSRPKPEGLRFKFSVSGRTTWAGQGGNDRTERRPPDTPRGARERRRNSHLTSSGQGGSGSSLASGWTDSRLFKRYTFKDALQN
jgi:hypothetical protein